MFTRIKTAIARTPSSKHSERLTLNIFHDNIKMPVDKFGRRTQRTVEASSSVVSLTQMNDTFLRRDGMNTAVGTTNMAGNTLTNVSDPVADHDTANKAYVDQNVGISKSGDTMYGDLMLSTDGDNDRVLGCTDLIARRFSIPLGTSSNRLYFIFRRNPVVMDTDHGFLVKAKNELVCQLGSIYEPNEITIYKNVRMNSNRITNLSESQLPHEVPNKLYVDRTPGKILRGYVPSLRSSSGANLNDELGVVITASTYWNTFYRPTNAFNRLYAGTRGIGGEWATNGEIGIFGYR